MQYQIRMTDPKARGVSADVLVDAGMDFLSLHLYLESLLSLEPGGVASFFVIDREGQRSVELIMFDDEGGGSAQRPMEGVRLQEYVDAGSVCFDYAFGIFLDRVLHFQVTDVYQEPRKANVPTCIAQRGRFRVDADDPLLRNLDDIDTLLQEYSGSEDYLDEE